MEKDWIDVLRRANVDRGFAGSAGPASPSESAAAMPPLTDDALAAVITGQIVPRMLLAHRLEAPEHPPTSVVQLPPTAEEVAQLADVAMQMDDARALALVESRLRSGRSYESVLLDFVAAAARALGHHWHDDGLTFADVTVGLATLQRVVTELRRRARWPLPQRPRPLS